MLLSFEFVLKSLGDFIKNTSKKMKVKRRAQLYMLGVKLDRQGAETGSQILVLWKRLWGTPDVGKSLIAPSTLGLGPGHVSLVSLRRNSKFGYLGENGQRVGVQSMAGGPEGLHVFTFGLWTLKHDSVALMSFPHRKAGPEKVEPGGAQPQPALVKTVCKLTREWTKLS